MHVLLVLLEIELLGFLHTHFDARLREIFDERLRFRHSFERTEKSQLTCLSLLLVCGTHLRFRFSQQFGGERGLLTNKSGYAVFVFIEELILAFGHRTADDQRRTGIINQDGVHLIDDRVVVSALHEVKRRSSHVITQVVETELVVRTESDVTSVRFAALIGVRTVFIDTIDRQAEEHIDRSVPLRVTFSKVVVDRHHVNALMRQRVEVHRKGCHKGLTLTRCHLGDLTLMQNDTTKQLYVIVDHVPLDLVTACHPVVLIHRLGEIIASYYLHKIKTRVSSQGFIHLGCGHLYRLALGKTTCGRFDDRICLRQNLVQHFLVFVLDLLLEFVHLVVDLLTLLNRRGLNLRFEVCDLRFLVCDSCFELVHQRPRMSTQLIIGERINHLVLCFDLIHYRLYGFHIFLRLVAEKLSN